MATTTARDETRAAEYPTRMFIDGSWCDALDGKTLAVINPADESILAEVAYGTRSEADRAIAAAERAFPAWRALSVYDRAKILKQTAELDARACRQDRSRPDPGAGQTTHRGQARSLHAADTFEWFAEEGKRSYGRIIPPMNVAKRHYAIKHPVGVVGTITPWNFPAALPSRKIAPALAVGCTVVSRPAEQTPLTLILMFECLADAGIPPGVANLVIGPARPIADAFFEHSSVRKISFTGSTEVGKELIRRSADQVKRLSLELGGHAPLIVFPDADVQQVAQAAVIGKFRNNGQVCIAPSRFYVHEKISKDFTDAAVELARNLKLGNGLEARRSGGPDVRGQGARENLGAHRGCPHQGGQGSHRRRPLETLRQGLLVRAHDHPRGQRGNEAHDRGAIRP